VIDSVTLTGNFAFANANGGTYFIVIKHRNSLETWSKAGGEIFTTGNTLNYDFTSAASQSYGSNMRQIGSKFCIYSGDVNQDGIVDASDLSLVDNDVFYLASGYVNTDLTGDNFVDASDLSIVDNNAFNFVIKITPETTMRP
jgi:Dockerin type I domain